MALARDNHPTHVGILGGGALGLAAGLALAVAGRHVTLVEREPQLGGLAAGFKVGSTDLEKFYHHIFRTDTTIQRYIQELGLGHKLLWGSPDSSVLRDGRIASLDSVGDVLRFPFLPPVDRLRLGASIAFLKLMPSAAIFEGQTAASWSRRFMGSRAFEVLCQPLLAGKFASRADDIAMSWWWSRFHERTSQLGYLRGGFQQMYDAFGDAIRASGGAVHLNCEATSIREVPNGVVVETSTAGALTFDRLLVTLPTRLFQRLTPSLPEAYVQRYQGPDHFGAHVVILALDRQLMDGVYWLNVTDRTLPFLAVVEHTNFLPPADYGGRHLVYLGNYLPMDHPLFRQSDEDVLASFLPALQAIRPDFDSSWVTEHWLFKAPFAQPIVTVDYPDKLPPHRTPIPGVYLANMAHVYPQDRGQNYSLRLGEHLARLILADAP